MKVELNKFLWFFYINSGLEITQHPEVSEKTRCLPDQWLLLPGDEQHEGRELLWNC